MSIENPNYSASKTFIESEPGGENLLDIRTTSFKANGKQYMLEITRWTDDEWRVRLTQHCQTANNTPSQSEEWQTIAAWPSINTSHQGPITKNDITEIHNNLVKPFLSGGLFDAKRFYLKRKLEQKVRDIETGFRFKKPKLSKTLKRKYQGMK